MTSTVAKRAAWVRTPLVPLFTTPISWLCLLSSTASGRMRSMGWRPSLVTSWSAGMPTPGPTRAESTLV